MLKPIFLFLDFDELAPHVLQTGEFLLNHIYPESKLTLFHILEEALTSPAYLLPYLKIESKRIKKMLEDMVQDLKIDFRKVEKTVVFGERWTNLEYLVQKEPPELVIIGYKPHLLKVPLAEKLLERLELTFLTVKRSPLNKLNRIACLFDFSADANMALKLASSWGQKTKAQLEIIHFYRLTSRHEIAKVDEISKLKEEIFKVWEEIIIKEKNTLKEIRVLKIDSLAEIKDLLDQSYDVVFLGRKGETLLKGIGSVAKQVLRMENIPVCIVKG